MKKDEKIYYFIGQDNIASLKGLHNQNIFKGNYKFNFFGEKTINFDNNLLSNEKSFLNNNNEQTPLKAHIVFYDLLRNQPYFENLNISLYNEVNILKRTIEKLEKENNHLHKLMFNLKGTPRFKEEMLDEADFAGKIRAKIYQYSGEGFGGGLDSGLFGRYGGYGIGRGISPEQSETQ